MAKQFDKLNPNLTEFIQAQKMFFVGTAAESGKVNISPKGMDTFRVIDEKRVIWLNLTGSGNETAAHLLRNNRITIMFCAFEGKPLILRLYGTAKIYHEQDEEWKKHIDDFSNVPGARQLIEIDLELVQTSCGFGVPLMEYQGARTQLMAWAEHKGKEGIKAYQLEKNKLSIDGFITDI